MTDVVIVGGGFAGVTAARELTMRGRSAVLVEARDRLGGRTHTASHDGHELELGGTWIHPAQPNVWAEITRYGLAVEDMPVPGGSQAVVSGGRVMELDGEGMGRALEALARLCAPATTVFATPYAEVPGADLEGYGERSLREVVDAFEVEPVLRDTLDAMCSTIANAPLDQVAASELLRFFALSGWSSLQLFAALSSVKIASGTRSLIDAIASQATLTETRLSIPVRRIVQTSDDVRVELANGAEVAARTALITLPMNVLSGVAFEPGLSEVKRAAARERHAGAGVKCYVHVAGDVGNVSVFAPESEAINWAATHHHGASGSLLIVFGNDPARLPLDDRAGMEAALRRLLPEARVESVFGWDWARDPFALGTWCMLKPGQPGRILPELRRSEGRLFFASADSAVAWRSSIDGAIESGYRAAREIDGYLSQ